MYYRLNFSCKSKPKTAYVIAFSEMEAIHRARELAKIEGRRNGGFKEKDASYWVEWISKEEYMKRINERG